MSDYEQEENSPPAGQESDDPVREQQQGKGYGEDEGERDDALSGDGG